MYGMESYECTAAENNFKNGTKKKIEQEMHGGEH